MKVDAEEYDYLDGVQASTINEAEPEIIQYVLLWMARHRIAGTLIAAPILIIGHIVYLWKFEDNSSGSSGDDNG